MIIEYKTQSAGICGDRYRFGFIKAQSEFSRTGCVNGYVPFISWRDANGEPVKVEGEIEPVRNKAKKILGDMVASHNLEPALWADFVNQIHKRFGQTIKPVLLYPNWDKINLTKKLQGEVTRFTQKWTYYDCIRHQLVKAIESGAVKIQNTNGIHAAIESGADDVASRYGVTMDAARRVLGDCLACAGEVKGDY